ncbi:MAG TPA: hypothetical protein VJB57_12180 [Dehalococcoidia bacterium]|nr:hypothetical protein [Dehalococcoidia bacterium]
MTTRYVRGMPTQPWSPDRPDVIDVLLTAEPEEAALLAAGSNYVYLLRMRHSDAGEGYAVYKPQRGEAPLSDFPSGTLYKREYAAFVVSEALGWGLVPPTVVRDEGLDGGLGVLQLFIEHDPAQHFFTLKDERETEMQRIAVFDWLTNNADRKGGHCILGNDGRIWCIDHGITFHAEDKLRTVIWDYQGQPVPAGLVDDVCAFAERLREDESLRGLLEELLLPPEMTRLVQRAALIVPGSVFPAPPPWRPYPWPMI